MSSKLHSYNCERCGKTVIVPYPYRAKSQRFCSLSCASKSYKRTKTWYEKVSDSLKTGKLIGCRVCGKKVYRTQGWINRNKYHYCSFECRNKAYKDELSGAGNPQWLGGRSFEPYSITWKDQVRDKARVRDNFKCQECDLPELEEGRKLAVHHIDYNKDNCELDNLICLCNRCHGKTNFNRDYWQDKFKARLTCH